MSGEIAAEFREDAPEAAAIERERRLQACRDRFPGGNPFASTRQPLTAEDVSLLHWTHLLAEAGHVGAQRLRERLLSRQSLVEEAASIDTSFVEATAHRFTTAALVLARREADRTAPDAALLQRWLRLMSNDGLGLAVAVREVAAIRGALIEADGVVLRREAQSAYQVVHEKPVDPESAEGRERLTGVVAAVVWQCASAEGPQSERLRERAAEVGSVHARLHYSLAEPPHPRLGLDNAGGVWSEIAAAIHEVRALAPITEADRGFFRSLLDPYGIYRAEKRRVFDESLRSTLLYELSTSRPRASERAAGSRLLLRAAELGSWRAMAACDPGNAQRLCSWLGSAGANGEAAARAVRELCAITGDLAPADLATRPEVVGKWLARDARLRKIGAALCLRTGAALELGELGSAPDLERAITWYATALTTRAREKETGQLTAAFCWEVACSFDPAEPAHVRNEPRLAVAWYERGLALGGQLCLQRLLEAVAAAELGLARDADAALQRLADFFSDRSRGIDFGHTRDTVAALRRCAAGDAASAAKWNAAANQLLSRGPK